MIKVTKEKNASKSSRNGCRERGRYLLSIFGAVFFVCNLLFLVRAHASTIRFVTSLADSGKGTLRECMQATGDRECWFSSALNSGVIKIKSPIIVKYPKLLVTGENSEHLIELRGAGIRIQASDVTIKHIAVRPGALYTDSKTFDGIVVWSTKEIKNVILDHLSLTWAVDENLSSYGPKISNIVVSNSIIAEGLHCSIHPDGCHSKGVLWGPDTKNIYMYNNLFAHNHDRNPRMQSGVTLSFINNFVYGWGGASGWNLLNFSHTATGSQVKLDFIGNLYKPSADSSTKHKQIYWDKNVPKTSKAYVYGNISPTRPVETMDERFVSALPQYMHSNNLLIDQNFVTPISVDDLPLMIEINVGPRPEMRSVTDARIVNEALTGTGRIKDCITGCVKNVGGWD